jgi:xylulokinase
MTDDFEPPFLIGVDVGTQSVRAVAFDAFGNQVAQARRPTPETRIAQDRLEYDPEALFTAVVECLGEVAGALAGRPVAGIAVASIGESCVLVDEAGRSLAPSIVWHDTRTEGEAERLRETVGIERVFEITGMQLAHIFTLCKLMWMRTHWPDAMRRTRKIMMIADWIAFRLSGVAATDFALASRTLYLDLRRRRWSDELLGLAGLDASILAPLSASGSALGPVLPDVLAATGLAGNPVVGVGAHDHVCGAMAAGMAQQGTMVDSIGTAEALLLATAEPSFDPKLPKANLFQGAFEAHRSLYFLGASVAYSGSAIEWLRGLVGHPPHETLIAEGENAQPGSEGVLFLPHMVGPTSSDPEHPVRGAFIGLTDTTTRGTLYRAVLEGLAMRTAFVLDTIVGLSGVPAPDRIRLISGGARNPLLVAIKAAAFGRPVTVVDASEATALGAALLGGVAAGLWPNLEVALAALNRREHSVEPDEALVRLYRDMRRSVFDRLQSILWPVDAKLMGIAAQTNRKTSGQTAPPGGQPGA